MINKLKKMSRLALVAVGIAIAVATPKASAGQQVMLSGGTNTVAAGNTTNTYRLYGDTTGNFTNGIPFGGSVGPNQFFNLNNSKDGMFSFGGTFANPSATNVTWTLTLAGSEDLAFWTNNVATVTIISPATTTNTLCGYTYIYSSSTYGVFPNYAIRSITVSPAFSTVSSTNLVAKCFTKTGL